MPAVVRVRQARAGVREAPRHEARAVGAERCYGRLWGFPADAEVDGVGRGDGRVTWQAARVIVVVVEVMRSVLLRGRVRGLDGCFG